ncbi:hypothetical protein ACQEU5_24975 [Marinactinospora thermotolerans]|uniref:hypothetical protein n=1 Tax=Marinactinospora thermotolerans TaxID=531310 RepID=UPI003D8BACA6
MLVPLVTQSSRAEHGTAPSRNRGEPDRSQLRALPPRVRVRIGEALLELAASDETDLLTETHPEHPDDPYVRRLRGVGFVSTILVYGHRVVALTAHPDG